VDCLPANRWKVIVVSPVVQVRKNGLILACADEFKSDLTTCWKEGVWTTGSLVHDCTGCIGVGWRLDERLGMLTHVPLSISEWDESWREAHLVKRHTPASSTWEANYQWVGLHLVSWIPWRKYRKDQATAKHRWEVAALTLRCEQAVMKLLTEGVAAVEREDGRPA
jgi:hypothetical protein